MKKKLSVLILCFTFVVFAFLGVNGAGKSNTINMMCAQLSMDSGQIIIDGNDIEKSANKVKEKHSTAIGATSQHLRRKSGRI